MLPYMSALNTKNINEALKKVLRTQKNLTTRTNMLDKMKEAWKERKLDTDRIPFKKDYIYYKYVHTNDSIIKLIEKFDPTIVKIPKKNSVQDLVHKNNNDKRNIKRCNRSKVLKITESERFFKFLHDKNGVKDRGTRRAYKSVPKRI